MGGDISIGSVLRSTTALFADAIEALTAPYTLNTNQPLLQTNQGFFIDFKLRDDIHCPVVIPDSAEYLPPAVRAALRTIARHIDTLPLTAHDNRSFYRGLETLTDRLITMAKQHNLIYPPGD